jgi:hypothetical protein
MYISKHFTGKYTMYKGLQIPEIMFPITTNTIEKVLIKYTIKIGSI